MFKVPWRKIKSHKLKMYCHCCSISFCMFIVAKLHAHMYLKLLLMALSCSIFLINTLTINFQIYPDLELFPKVFFMAKIVFCKQRIYFLNLRPKNSLYIIIIWVWKFVFLYILTGYIVRVLDICFLSNKIKKYS